MTQMKKKFAIVDYNDPNKIHYSTNYVIRQSPPTLKGTADNADKYMLLEIVDADEAKGTWHHSSYYWTSNSLETLRELAETYPMWQDLVNYQARKGGELIDISHFNVDEFDLSLSRPSLYAIENAIWEQADRMRATANALEEQGDHKGAQAQNKEAEVLEAAIIEVVKQIKDQMLPDYLREDYFKEPPF